MPRAVTLPLDEGAVRDLHVGDDVLVSGRLVTGRDKVLRLLAAMHDPAFERIARGTILYHCAPVVSQDPATKEYRFVAAGPSPSSRAEPWQADVIARYGLRGVLGKGGMGPRTRDALRRHGAVYLHAIGGLAVVLARRVTRVVAVHRLDELGVPEAIWEIEVKDFPAVVTMDAHGRSLHETVDADMLAKVIERAAG